MNKCELEAFSINSSDPASVVNNLESAVVLLDKSQLNWCPSYRDTHAPFLNIISSSFEQVQSNFPVDITL